MHAEHYVFEALKFPMLPDNPFILMDYARSDSSLNLDKRLWIMVRIG